MRARRLSGSSGALVEVNVTPMIDVMLCLIVFFLIVGTLAANRRSAVDLPVTRAGGDHAAARDAAVVTVRPMREGEGGGGGVEMFVDGVRVSESFELVERLAAAGVSAQGKSVSIRGSRRLRVADIEPVLRACRRLGAPAAYFAAERDDAGGTP